MINYCCINTSQQSPLKSGSEFRRYKLQYRYHLISLKRVPALFCNRKKLQGLCLGVRRLLLLGVESSTVGQASILEFSPVYFKSSLFPISLVPCSCLFFLHAVFFLCILPRLPLMPTMSSLPLSLFSYPLEVFIHSLAR